MAWCLGLLMDVADATVFGQHALAYAVLAYAAEYFRRRVAQARRDSEEALTITAKHCDTPDLQRAALRALEFKCELLWAILDSIDLRYGKK